MPSMLLEISGEITPDRMKEWNQSKKTKQNKTKQKNPKYPVVDVTGDRSKVRYCKEEYCIGTWNVRSMNQGKLAVVNRRYQE